MANALPAALSLRLPGASQEAAAQGGAWERGCPQGLGSLAGCAPAWGSCFISPALVSHLGMAEDNSALDWRWGSSEVNVLNPWLRAQHIVSAEEISSLISSSAPPRTQQAGALTPKERNRGEGGLGGARAPGSARSETPAQKEGPQRPHPAGRCGGLGGAPESSPLATPPPRSAAEDRPPPCPCTPGCEAAGLHLQRPRPRAQGEGCARGGGWVVGVRVAGVLARVPGVNACVRGM